ncbi:MAG: oxygenase MpaB family protein [Anaerolineae bacterium]
MDAVKDQVEIFTQLFLHEFPVEFLLAAEIAQLHSFTFPNGTRLLHATGEFEKNSLKRLDDTRAILHEFGRDGFDSPRAATTAEHLNAIHGMYNIPNDEFLHTLSTFIYDLWDFIDQYGWRKLTPTEEQVIYLTYCKMGRLMKIKDIPESFEAYRDWKKTYELENQAYSETNHKVAEGLMKGIREMLPPILGPFVLPFVLSLKDERFAQLLGYKYPNNLVRGFFRSAMWVRKQFNKIFTIWDVLDFEQAFFTSYKSYPNGFNPLKLGPKKIIERIAKVEHNETAISSLVE